GFAHGLLDEVLAVAVEGARGFIEQQDGRVAKDRPGDGDSLPLAAGELDATLADQRVIAVLELRYELVRVRPVRSPDDLLGRRPHDEGADTLLRRAELLIELRYPLAEVVRSLKERPGERRDHDEITGADDPVHPGIERASHESEPHQDIHHVLHAAQPHD